MKIIFIGNRFNVLNELLKLQYNVEIFALENSFLVYELINKNIKFQTFNVLQKDLIKDYIAKSEFDVLVSNGCPFLLPICKGIMINVHPSYLPKLRGRAPINGVLFTKAKYFGATMHYLNEKPDDGDIIYQEKHLMSNDIDLALLYFIVFDLEAIVFRKGWTNLVERNFQNFGKPQKSYQKSYFKRTSELMCVDFKFMSSSEINKRIKSFGIKSQGVISKGLKSHESFIFYSSMLVNNNYLNNIFKNYEAGEILLKYEDKMLIKSIDGIIKIDNFKIV
jgi:methionyl-tRNA formyltransferase